MDFYLYIIIIIGLTIFMVFFGGHNNQVKVEYENNYFQKLNSIIIFENKLNKINNDNIFTNKNYVNINKYFDTTDILIPNFVNCFFIKILPYTIFNIFNLIDKKDMKTHIMILFNHKKYNNLELLVDNTENNLYKDDYFNNFNNFKSSGYFYDLEKTVSITGIFHIYNNSTEIIYITCFILKKPFWHQ
jgi:hypothetical protein